MEIKLNLEQISYLKSLDSKKNKRKFLLDCFIENVELSKIEMHFSYAQKPISESNKLVTPQEIESKLIKEAKMKGYKNGNYKCLDLPIYTEKEVEDNFFLDEKGLWHGKVNCANLIFSTKNNEWAEIIELPKNRYISPIELAKTLINFTPKESKIEFNENGLLFFKKPNYSTEEIELVKHNINQREISEQGSELLKFDILEDESLTQNDLENNSVPKTEEAVKITLENGTVIYKTKWMVSEEPKKQNVILDQFDIQEDKDIKSHEYCNTIINFSNLIVKCVNMQSDPTNILNQFLLSVNKYYHYKTSETIDFIDELFPQLKNNQSAK